jgi:hypothetical protein
MSRWKNDGNLYLRLILAGIRKGRFGMSRTYWLTGRLIPGDFPLRIYSQQIGIGDIVRPQRHGARCIVVDQSEDGRLSTIAFPGAKKSPTGGANQVFECTIETQLLWLEQKAGAT